MNGEMDLDYILNGAGYGDIGSRLADVDFDPGALRPFLSESRKDSYISITNKHGKKETVLVPNADATLLKDEWIQLDEAVMRVARERLGLVSE